MKIKIGKMVSEADYKNPIFIPLYKTSETVEAMIPKDLANAIKNITHSAKTEKDDREIKKIYVNLNGNYTPIYLLSLSKKPENFTCFAEYGYTIGKILKKDKIKSFSFVAFEDALFDNSLEEKEDIVYTKNFTHITYFGLYTYEKYLTKKQAYKLKELKVITQSEALGNYLKNFEETNTIFENIYLSRDLINEPANDLTPAIFSKIIKNKSPESLTVQVYNEKDIEEKGLNLINAVGKGSANKPRFVKLTYKGNPGSKKNIALVGKGVTFDSGGTNLKPTGYIETMKTDMSGASVMFALTRLIAESKLKVNVNTFIPLVENTIGTSACRPGDIYKSASGKTVEILNTDAEGRLILADALYMATKEKPDLIVDAATLTGACVVALGSHIAGMFSNRPSISESFLKASASIGEDFWELPLYKGYTSNLKSKIADIQNISSQKREAGTIIAALFLEEFVANYPWIHLDIAGVAFLEEEHKIYGNAASGFGIRTLYEFIKKEYC